MTEGLRFCRCLRRGRCDTCKARKAELEGRLDGLREAAAVLQLTHPEAVSQFEAYASRVNEAAKAEPPVPFVELYVPLPGSQP